VWPPKHFETAVDSRGSLQLEPDFAQGDGGAGTPQEWRNRGGLLFLLVNHLRFQPGGFRQPFLSTM
jgi:hypothetical protein